VYLQRKLLARSPSVNFLVAAYATMPCNLSFGLAKQSHYPAAFFDRQSLIVEQRSAMQNDPPLAFDQEATNVISAAGTGQPDRDGNLVAVCNSNISKAKVYQHSADCVRRPHCASDMIGQLKAGEAVVRS